MFPLRNPALHAVSLWAGDAAGNDHGVQRNNTGGVPTGTWRSSINSTVEFRHSSSSGGTQACQCGAGLAYPGGPVL